MFDRLKARAEWKFFGVPLKADRPLANGSIDMKPIIWGWAQSKATS